jgi:carbonic anhydrase/acetyltransferase-like protein (isoleucine patch superfamily)
MLKRFKVLTRVPRQFVKQWFRHQQLEWHNPGLVVVSPVALQYDDLRAISIGADVIIGAFSEIVVLSESPYSSIPGRLEIGDRAVIGAHANIRATGGRITIGRNALIAQQVSLIAANHVISDQRPYRDLPWDSTKVDVEIGENVWLGAGVMVLPGCRIGANAVVGAGTVVTKNIPANEIWVGNPARKLRNI